MIREGVVLAAGVGSRLSEIARGAKFALRIAGRPLIHYPILSLVSAGVDRIVIVTRGAALPVLRRLVERLDVSLEIEYCVNNRWRRENGYSLYVASRCVEAGEFYVSMSDHIYPSDVAYRLLEAASRHPDAVAIVAGDREPRYVNVEEATRIRARGVYVEAIGKGLYPWNYVDAGVFVMRREIFDVARRLAERRERFGLSDVISEAVRQGYRVAVADITGLPWAEVDTPEDYDSLVSGWKRELPRLVAESWGIGLAVGGGHGDRR